jgi:ElaB/YqjD/DUF883 family membrane-anchored ribosome-binding protein
MHSATKPLKQEKLDSISEIEEIESKFSELKESESKFSEDKDEDYKSKITKAVTKHQQSYSFGSEN